MDKIEAVLKRFPRYAYDLDNSERFILGKSKLGSARLGGNTSLYKLIKAIVDEFNITMANIDRISKMIDINTISPEDIYNRFGALLNIERNKNETAEQYRDRLKVSITSLSGGTAEAIKYAVASGLGINDNVEAMNHIHVYDAWEYNGDEESIVKDYGYIVCTIDLNHGNYPDLENTTKIVAESADDVKAAGVVIQFLYYNFRIIYYAELDNITYASLGTSTYSQVGE